MSPTAMLIGAISALALPARWSIPTAAAAWAAIIAVTVDSDPAVVTGALLVGCLNGAVGVALGRALRLSGDALVDRSRSEHAV